MKVVAVFSLLACAAVVASAQTWTDRAEYDLALAIRSQSAPADRLTSLQEWKEKYPNSALKLHRAELMLSAAQALGDTTKMLAAAREIVAADASSLTGLYWVAILGPAVKESGEAHLKEVTAAAGKLGSAAPAYFSSKAALARYPNPDAAAKEQARVEAAAHRAIGWAEWQSGNLDAAEASLNRSLQLEAESALTSAWLGSVLTLQKLPEKQPLAIWHLARASFLDGDGALTSTQRREVRTLLETAYLSYHGEPAGLEQIGEQTRSGALPPTNFTIESAAEIMQRRQDEEMARTNPELLNWLKIRRRLLTPEGDAFFGTLVGTQTPPLKGYVIRCDSPSKATEVIIGLTQADLEEGALRFEAPAGKCPDPGTELLFTGSPSEFVREPLLVRMAVSRDTVTNWPASSRPR